MPSWRCVCKGCAGLNHLNIFLSSLLTLCTGPAIGPRRFLVGVLSCDGSLWKGEGFG